MEIPAAAWYGAIFRRTSSRTFDPSPLDGATLDRLQAVCRDFRPFPEARAVLVAKPADPVLRGIVGTYGKIINAPSFVAFVGRADSPRVDECVGYTGEGIVLEADSLGLGTCWVGGFFRRDAVAELVETAENERIFAVTPVGRRAPKVRFSERVMKAFARSARRLEVPELIVGGKVPEGWMEKAIAAARLAPSAVNRQPWRFRVDGGSVVVLTDRPDGRSMVSPRLDCGIAMLHFEVGALAAGVKGTWRFLVAPEVARFMPD